LFVAAAEALGLRGLIFTDPARCRAHLIAKGLLPA
jgi:putative hydrolase of the HAD superfamily